MMACRICAAALATPAYEAPAPALTSVMTTADIPTRVYLCRDCGHAQSADLPDVDAFYDSGYRISLSSDDHDQIVGVSAAGEPIYRTDRQAEIGLRLLDLPHGAAILDYGAAKAGTLRKMHRARDDLRPHVFDVSADYAAAWDGWIAGEDQAIHTLPPAWSGRFAAAMSHFVLEHVADPIGFLATLHGLIAEGGQLLVSVPDAESNSGDMIVADHLNHFSEVSLRRALGATGFGIRTIDRTSFPGALFVVATRGDGAGNAVADAADAGRAFAQAGEICAFWKRATVRLDDDAERLRGRRAAIYGAGFYGSWILRRIEDLVDVAAFLDQNPHLAGSTHFGRPVVRPDGIGDDVDVVFVGLNPARAREIIANVTPLHRPGLDLVWLEG